jgi:hypothetical protein
MMPSLTERCRAFLKTPVPAGLDFVGGSIAEKLLGAAASGQKLDDEARELLELAIMDSRERAASLSGEAQDYLLKSASLLEELSSER